MIQLHTVLKNTTIFLCLFFITFSSQAKPIKNFTSSIAENKVDSFYSITRNKEWTVSKLYSSTTQIDSKSGFNDYVFTFSQNDASQFTILAVGKDNMIGHWTSQSGEKIIFSIPLLSATSDTTTISSNDSSFNESVKLLCAWPLNIIELQPSTLKFSFSDATWGNVSIEFTKKEVL